MKPVVLLWDHKFSPNPRKRVLSPPKLHPSGHGLGGLRESYLKLSPPERNPPVGWFGLFLGSDSMFFERL